jgi:membrane-bound lytic murein transglycosylase D
VPAPEGAEPKEANPEAAIQAEIDQALEYYEASQDFWHQGELENALHALDQAFEQIIGVDTSEMTKFIQQKDDLRYMISKRILEIYASRHTTAQGNHNAIPHEMNEHVKREVEYFTHGKGREFFIASYKRSGRYRPYILKELRKAGLPEDLSWLPLIESGFKIRAFSRARALGLWQFISSTGYKFGLKRNQYIDERLDPFASTHAAIAYLKELHGIFGDWTTVMAGYNCGEYRVLRTIRTQNVNYLDNFWDLYRLLPRETARYVPKFMAALHIINNLDKYGMADIEVDPPVRFETVKIEKQMYLKDIAGTLDIDKDKLIDLNPELRYKLLPEGAYELKIPPGKRDLLLARLDEIPEFTQTTPGIVYHRVRHGETLSTIASRYRTSVNQIALYNNIRRHNYIVAGRILKIPHARQPGPAESTSTPITYTVRRGDSLWTLAKRYDTTTKKIQALNDLDTVNLYIGQQLKIPAAGRTAPNVYRVRRGDSPYTIARRHNMSLNQFLRANNLSRHSTIYPGQRVYVK